VRGRAAEAGEALKGHPAEIYGKLKFTIWLTNAGDEKPSNCGSTIATTRTTQQQQQKGRRRRPEHQSAAYW
jgi:hypothetical protein